MKSISVSKGPRLTGRVLPAHLPILGLWFWIYCLKRVFVDLANFQASANSSRIVP
jgi:hypothetical protein